MKMIGEEKQQAKKGASSHAPMIMSRKTKFPHVYHGRAEYGYNGGLLGKGCKQDHLDEFG
jgi:hypothetical protein